MHVLDSETAGKKEVTLGGENLERTNIIVTIKAASLGGEPSKMVPRIRIPGIMAEGEWPPVPTLSGKEKPVQSPVKTKMEWYFELIPMKNDEGKWSGSLEGVGAKGQTIDDGLLDRLIAKTEMKYGIQIRWPKQNTLVPNGGSSSVGYAASTQGAAYSTYRRLAVSLQMCGAHDVRLWLRPKKGLEKEVNVKVTARWAFDAKSEKDPEQAPWQGAVSPPLGMLMRAELYGCAPAQYETWIAKDKIVTKGKVAPEPTERVFTVPKGDKGIEVGQIYLHIAYFDYLKLAMVGTYGQVAVNLAAEEAGDQRSSSP